MRLNINSGSWQPDIWLNLNETLIAQGRAFRFCSSIFSIASPAFFVVAWTTPQTGKMLTVPGLYSKTGDELQVQLFEAPTVGGLTAFSWVNQNRSSANDDPFINSGFGLSTGGATITGGTLIETEFVPGTSQGNQVSAEQTLSVGNMVLMPSTTYALKISAIGGTTKAQAILTASFLPYGV